MGSSAWIPQYLLCHDDHLKCFEIVQEILTLYFLYHESTCLGVLSHFLSHLDGEKCRDLDRIFFTIKTHVFLCITIYVLVILL